MFLKLITFLLFVGHISTSPLSRSDIAQPRTSRVDYQLPTHLKPLTYVLELEPDFTNDRFNGSVAIEFEVLQISNNITVHTRQLVVEEASITLSTQGGGAVPTVTGTSFSDDDREFYTISLSAFLTVGNVYTVTFGNFQGILNLNNAGFYLAIYNDRNGNPRKFGTTQFESTSARRAFPCFDEPALKANFTLNMIRPADYYTISNMDRTNTEDVELESIGALNNSKFSAQ